MAIDALFFSALTNYYQVLEMLDYTFPTQSLLHAMVVKSVLC
jgi:hypothetical protein